MEVNQQGYEQEKCKGSLGILDSEAAQLLLEQFLQVLPNLQPIPNLLLWDGLSSCILF